MDVYILYLNLNLAVSSNIIGARFEIMLNT